MSNKTLCLPQLDKLEQHYQEKADECGTSDPYWIYFEGWVEAIKKFRLMLEGVDVTCELRSNS